MKVNQIAIRRCLFIAAGVMLMAVLYVLSDINTAKARSPIMFNEVCSNNFSIIDDNAGNYFDYIELYNTSEEEIRLDGYFLSDSRDELQKVSLAGLSIEGKGKLLLAADNRSDKGADHASFKISSTGENLYLSNEDKQILDMVFIPELEYNESYARVYDGAEEWEIMSATPMKENESGQVLYQYQKTWEELGVSEAAGFYHTGFELEIFPMKNGKMMKKGLGNGKAIYYTLDGSEPTLSSRQYRGKIEIPQGVTILRARVLDEKREGIGPVLSATYLVGEIEELQGNAPEVIISLMVESDDLSGENGIITNLDQEGREAEREANAEFFFGGVNI